MDAQERANLTDLLAAAQQQAWVDADEAAAIHCIRHRRNDLVHFRRPGDESRVMHRAAANASQGYELIEKDARIVVMAVIKFLTKMAIEP